MTRYTVATEERMLDVVERLMVERGVVIVARDEMERARASRTGSGRISSGSTASAAPLAMTSARHAAKVALRNIRRAPRRCGGRVPARRRAGGDPTTTRRRPGT